MPGHDAAHSHAHHGPHTGHAVSGREIAARPLALSVMAQSAVFRVLAVSGVLVVLWLAIAWAVSLA